MTVLHIESDFLWVSAIGQAVGSWSEVRYLGSSPNGRDGCRSCEQLLPDVVVMDLDLPDVDGLELANRIAITCPRTKIVALSTRSDESLYYRLCRNAISSLIWKSPRCVEFLRVGLGVIRLGGRYLPPAESLAVQRFRTSPTAFFKILSEREISLLPFFAQGASDSEIGLALGLSSATAHSHRQRIMAKLGVHRQMDLMRWASRRGFCGGGEVVSVKGEV